MNIIAESRGLAQMHYGTMTHCPTRSAIPAILGDCLQIHENGQARRDPWDNAFFKISSH